MTHTATDPRTIAAAKALHADHECRHLGFISTPWAELEAEPFQSEYLGVAEEILRHLDATEWDIPTAAARLASERGIRHAYSARRSYFRRLVTTVAEAAR